MLGRANSQARRDPSTVSPAEDGWRERHRGPERHRRPERPLTINSPLIFEASTRVDRPSHVAPPHIAPILVPTNGRRLDACRKWSINTARCGRHTSGLRSAQMIASCTTCSRRTRSGVQHLRRVVRGPPRGPASTQDSRKSSKRHRVHSGTPVRSSI
jgi:hypothetical protein